MKLIEVAVVGAQDKDCEEPYRYQQLAADDGGSLITLRLVLGALKDKAGYFWTEKGIMNEPRWLRLEKPRQSAPDKIARASFRRPGTQPPPALVV